MKGIRSLLFGMRYLKWSVSCIMNVEKDLEQKICVTIKLIA